MIASFTFVNCGDSGQAKKECREELTRFAILFGTNLTLLILLNQLVDKVTTQADCDEARTNFILASVLVRASLANSSSGSGNQTATSCNTTGVATGCNSSFPFSCNNSSSCYSSLTSCRNDSTCTGRSNSFANETDILRIIESQPGFQALSEPKKR